MTQLKEEGADFTTVDYKDRTPLHIACIKGHLNVVKLLLKQSKSIYYCFNWFIDVNLDKIDDTGCSPLYLAIAKGHS